MSHKNKEIQKLMRELKVTKSKNNNNNDYFKISWMKIN